MKARFTCVLTILLLSISANSIAQNWSALQILNTVRYDDICFIDESTGWAVDATGSTIHKTTDGGELWEYQFFGLGDYMRSVTFLDENIGFVGTLTPNLYKTTSGGQSWEIVNIPGVDGICGLAVAGDETVYGCGAYFEPAYIIKSTDAGENWNFIDMSNHADALVDVLFLDENTGYVAGANGDGGVILKTTDGGDAWTEIYNTEIPGEYVWKLHSLFSNSDVLFGSVQSFEPFNGKLLKSFDGGETWGSLDIDTAVPDSTVNPMIQGVGFVSEDHGWVSGYFTNLLETFDGGVTWEDIGAGSIGSVNRFQVFNENLVYASGHQVYKYTNTLNVNEYSIQPPKGLTINVSPNPLSEELNISIEFERKNHMIITLFDEQGRKVKQLAREIIPSKGEKQYSFDFPYPAGVYFLHFHGDVGAKSMKIIKN